MLRTLAGLGKMGVQWTTLPESFQSTIFDIMLFSECSGDEGVKKARALPSLLYSLGLMGASMASLPEAVSQQLQAQLTAALTAPEMESQGLSNALWGLVKLGATWPGLQEGTRGALLQACATLACHMRLDEISSLVNSLAKLEVHTLSLPHI